ncbi:pyrophosphate--fructose 6-phosphate 1-phosphotransferase subunit beta 1-like isoform X1 [Brassica napus]|uniref:pyrophosphate--fructose 6-phosphate 1-phosphotransferase subunit beta 1 isoform X1 n=1 Tax=Brassica napus TaxID=3708 RepID=UPI0020787776|nr:pyrophosphate--fructose 6-phosphate 1-phosphotransferase subunit beta 1 isoform X1 [Brassica napus]XP_048626934.1 pyrophosphate--fructose 6-phosphate 1-phosphotransferase subunit beta 1-like isoform X1 [Brassica napus]
MKCKYVELNAEYIQPYRNQGGFDMICSGRDKIETPEQFKQAEEKAKKLDLDGLVVIDGDDSNTNACLLAENFSMKVPSSFSLPPSHRTLLPSSGRRSQFHGEKST